ncbi:hypothetical protein Ddc_17934 [Ditylenchus destructor]|nr:hypothetical protein Ddc_17934 [Ditylenchus destructor]
MTRDERLAECAELLDTFGADNSKEMALMCHQTYEMLQQIHWWQRKQLNAWESSISSSTTLVEIVAEAIFPGETGTNRFVSPRGSDWCITRPDPSCDWKVSFGPNPGLPEAVTPDRSNISRRDRYQSLCLIERKRLVYHTPGSELRLEMIHREIDYKYFDALDMGDTVAVWALLLSKESCETNGRSVSSKALAMYAAAKEVLEEAKTAGSSGYDSATSLTSSQKSTPSKNSAPQTRPIRTAILRLKQR